MRTVLALVEAGAAIEALREAFAVPAGPFGMQWTMRDRSERRRVLLMA